MFAAAPVSQEADVMPGLLADRSGLSADLRQVTTEDLETPYHR